MEERLQKFLARAGVASRRAAEELIRRGEVLVNGSTAELGAKVNPVVDVITWRGRVVRLEEEKRYLMLNKPTGVVSTAKDPQGRPTVLDLLPDHRERLYPVGRLDLDTAGLLLLTNDGDFSYALTHPKFKVMKRYWAWLKGIVHEGDLERLRAGVMLDDGITAPAAASILDQSAGQTKLELIIHEGRKRQVRRMCAAVGYSVLKLTRVQLGDLWLGDLALGKTRALTAAEVANLQVIAGHGGRNEGESEHANQEHDGGCCRT